MATLVTVSLSFNSSTGSYTLSSNNTSLVSISSDQKSYIIDGYTYTPSVSVSQSGSGYKLNSWTMPSGSTVGTTRPSSSTSGSPQTTSDYTSSTVNYYTSNSSYDYTTLSISLNSSTGSVSGDTNYCSWTTISTHVPDYQWGNEIQWDSSIFISSGSSSSLGLYNLYSQTQTDYTGSATYVKATSSLTRKTFSVSVNKSNGIVLGTGTSYCNAEDIVADYGSDEYSFNTVSWNSSYGSYSKYGSASTSSTSSSQQYRKSTTSYYPDIYSYFKFTASTGSITWTHSGSGSSSSTYINKIENNSTFDIVSNTSYTHNSTTWNFTNKSLGVIYIDKDNNTILNEVNRVSSSSKTSLQLYITSSPLKFTDKNGTTTNIKSVVSG